MSHFHSLLCTTHLRKNENCGKTAAAVMKTTSCDTLHYHPIPLSPSCFTGLSLPFLQTSAFPTFNLQVPFCSQARPFPMHLSPKLPPPQSIKPGKELPLAPSQPLSRRAEAPQGAPQHSPELRCNTSSKSCASRRWTMMPQT